MAADSQASSSGESAVQLLDAVLERAADEIPELTAAAMEHFYRTWPEARASFEFHGGSDPGQLEAEMVDTALYFIMTWLERDGEIAVTVNSSVPHHITALKVDREWYTGLLGSVIAVIAATIPAEDAAGAALLSDIRRDLVELIDQATP